MQGYTKEKLQVVLALNESFFDSALILKSAIEQICDTKLSLLDIRGNYKQE